MNLRVDLIFPTEQRSASVVNLKLVTRIAMIVVPCILLLVIAMVVSGFLQLKSEQKALQTEWGIAKPKQDAAAKLRKELAANTDLEKRLKGWLLSRVDFHGQMQGLQREFPREIQIQLARLQISTAIQMVDKKIPGRAVEIIMQGTAFGEDAEYHVQELRKNLKKSPILSPNLDTVEVTSFAAVKSDKASKLDRAFAIEMKYLPRKFE